MKGLPCVFIAMRATGHCILSRLPWATRSFGTTSQHVYLLTSVYHFATGASADGESHGQAGRGAGCGEWPGRGGPRVHEGHRLHQSLQEHERNPRYHFLISNLSRSLTLKAPELCVFADDLHPKWPWTWQLERKWMNPGNTFYFFGGGGIKGDIYQSYLLDYFFFQNCPIFQLN